MLYVDVETNRKHYKSILYKWPHEKALETDVLSGAAARTGSLKV